MPETRNEMTQEELDEAVHEAKAAEAAEINNEGPEAQRAYLERPEPGRWVMNYLDCSTKHISVEDARLLKDPPDELLTYENEYGWFVHVPDDLCEEDFVQTLVSRGVGPSLLQVLQFAHANDCVWVKLDRDGTEIPTLPRSDW